MLLCDADTETNYQIKVDQATAYEKLKKDISFQNKDLIDLLKGQLIKSYPKGNLVVSLDKVNKAAPV